MAFVNERISDEDAKKYDPDDRILTRSDRWTIDRDSETFLTDGGRARMEPGAEYMFIEYILFWQKTYIIFYAKRYFDSSVKPEDTLVIEEIRIPEQMPINKEALFQVMKEALSAYAGSGEVGREYKVNYIFDFSEIYFSKVK